FLLFSFSLTRPPPPPTLFPYTTLFRSAGAAFVPLSPRIPADRLDSMLVECTPKWAIVTDDLKESFSSLSVSKSIHLLSLPVEREDRKSTRLNSSHLVISYAVFCLKKKK